MIFWWESWVDFFVQLCICFTGTQFFLFLFWWRWVGFIEEVPYWLNLSMVVDLLGSWCDFVHFDCIIAFWDEFVEFDWWVRSFYCWVGFNCNFEVDVFGFCLVRIWCWWVFNCVLIIFGTLVMHFFLIVYSFRTDKPRNEFTFSWVIFLPPFLIFSNLQITSQHFSLYLSSHSAHIQIPE